MNNIQLSKKLSYVLRHHPESVGLIPDKAGWVNVSDLLDACNISRAILERIVKTNNKKRFTLDTTNNRIRAAQGHSFPVVLDYLPVDPPVFLYHGTGQNRASSLMLEGICSMSRVHVHLSSDVNTAVAVGSRHGKPVVATVYAREMSEDGYDFYLADNGVWLTDYVPVEYFSWRKTNE